MSKKHNFSFGRGGAFSRIRGYRNGGGTRGGGTRGGGTRGGGTPGAGVSGQCRTDNQCGAGQVCSGGWCRSQIPPRSKPMPPGSIPNTCNTSCAAGFRQLPDCSCVPMGTNRRPSSYARGGLIDPYDNNGLVSSPCTNFCETDGDCSPGVTGLCCRYYGDCKYCGYCGGGGQTRRRRGGPRPN